MTGSERLGTHAGQFARNRKKIIATQSVCALCGKPVDKTLRYPNPLSPSVDHIIPINRGGHPSDIDNLQLTHWVCNRLKSDKLVGNSSKQVETMRNLPLAMNWKEYKSE